MGGSTFLFLQLQILYTISHIYDTLLRFSFDTPLDITGLRCKVMGKKASHCCNVAVQAFIQCGTLSANTFMDYHIVNCFIKSKFYIQASIPFISFYMVDVSLISYLALHRVDWCENKSEKKSWSFSKIHIIRQSTSCCITLTVNRSNEASVDLVNRLVK